MKIGLVVAVSLVGTLVPAIAHGQPSLNPDDPTQTPPVVVINPSPPAHKKTVQPAEDYETRTSPWNAPVFTTGAIVFAGSYGGAVITAAASENDTIDRGNDRLYIPLAGPWLALEDRHDCPRVPGERCDNETAKRGLLVLDGVLQAGGVITMLTGLFSPHEHVVRRPVVSKRVRVSPRVGGHLGLSVVGSF